MTHLDEGQLHAYLDGQATAGETSGREIEQHLAGCAACRARLDEERRVRDRARAILAEAGPTSLTPPPFDAVLQRAARKRETRSAIRPTAALAWAASLALAITVGWYARGLVIRGGGAAEAAGAAAGPEEEVRASAIQAAPPASRQVAQSAPARAEATQRTREATDVLTPAAPAAPPAAVPAAQDRPLANLAAAESKVERDTEPTPVRVTEAPMPRAAPEPALQRVEPGAAAAGFVEQAWVTVPPAEAERRLDGPLATIPGLPSLGTMVSGTGPSTVARTIQVLGPGLTIELVQQRALPAGAERAAKERIAAPAPMPQAGRAVGAEPGRSVTVQWEGFSVTGRALVPADSLQKLLGRLRRP